MDAVTVAAAQAELAKVRNDWQRRPGVTALDVGLKRQAGRPTGDVAVRVFVEKKRPKKELPANEIFPTHLGQVPVDVIEASFGLESR